MKLTSARGRRDFLKAAAAGIAGLSAARADTLLSTKSTAWTSRQAINPAIDNMKVVCCYDTAMLKPNATTTNFSSQNNAVNASTVYANLDEMARQLTAKPNQPLLSASDAWKAIFRSSKAWTDTKVAIKVNAVCLSNMPRIAVVAKLCNVLSGFGVQGKNIIVYDGCNDASGNAKYTPYFSLTDSTKINAQVSVQNSLLGGLSSVTIDGWPGSFTCTSDLVNGNVDILINLAANKGHDRAANGYFTLCMKNHYGSFNPPSGMHDNTVPFISINKHDAILGGTPTRQQLCIIDSLLGSIYHYPDTPPDVPPPCRLIMGTFAPAVDYLCCKKVREPIMNAVHNETVVDSLLSYFGYTSSEAQWQEFTPGTPVSRYPGAQPAERSVDVVLARPDCRRRLFVSPYGPMLRAISK